VKACLRIERGLRVYGSHPRLTKRRANQFALQKFRNQRPDEIGEIGLIAIGLRRSETMVAEMKVMPLQRLTVGVKAFHDLLLHGKSAVLIVAAVKNHRGALDLTRGIARMTRPDARRLLVAHRRIIRDKGAHAWRRGDEMNTQPSAHAVADYRDA